MVNAPNMAQNRAQGSGSGNNHRASGTSHIPHNAKQPANDGHRLEAQNLSATTNDPRIRSMATKPSTVNKGVIFSHNLFSKFCSNLLKRIPFYHLIW